MTKLEVEKPVPVKEETSSHWVTFKKLLSIKKQLKIALEIGDKTAEGGV